jgi:hypothetical protein
MHACTVRALCIFDPTRLALSFVLPSSLGLYYHANCPCRLGGEEPNCCQITMLIYYSCRVPLQIYSSQTPYVMAMNTMVGSPKQRGQLSQIPIPLSREQALK